MSTPYYGQPVNVGSYRNIAATTAGVIVKAGEGALYQITFNKPLETNVVTVYDGLSTGGTVIATITVPATQAPVTLTYNAYFSVGLFVVSATAASDFTITYK